MSDTLTFLIRRQEEFENRIASLERQENVSTGIVSSVTASSPLSSSGGTTPNITHNNSGVTANTYTNATVAINATGHITSASSGTAPVTTVTASSPLSSSGGATPDISHNVSGVTASTYTYSTVSVNATGHVTSASSGTAPVTAISVTAPVTSTGGLTPTLGVAITTTNNGGAVALQTGAPVAQTGSARLSNFGQNVLTLAASSSVDALVATSQTGAAVRGTSSSSGDGINGTSSSGSGVVGTSTSGAGIVASSSSSTGLAASSNTGVGILASSTSNYGISVDKINVTTSRSFGGILRGNYVSAFPGSPATGEHIIHTDLLYSEWYYDGSAWRQLTIPSKTTNFTMTDTPPTGMRVYREDLDITCSYDGTRWLSGQKELAFTYAPGLGTIPLSATPTNNLLSRQNAPSATYALYVIGLVIKYTVNTTLNATDRWTIDLQKQNNAGTSLSLLSAAYDTSQAGTIAAGTAKLVQINPSSNAFALTDIYNLFVAVIKVNAPGTLAVEAGQMLYKLIIT